MSGQVTILGCGASAGVPVIGCECAVCQSDNLRNKRSRVSVLIEVRGVRLLVDASPDLRMQALNNRFKSIDGLFITHAHADHTQGLDDVRSFNYHAQKALPLFSDADTLAALQTRFDYVFQPPPRQGGWFRAALEPHTTYDGERFALGGVDFMPFYQHHGKIPSYGLRVDNVAYSTDVKAFPESSEPYLYDLDLWIVDCLGYAEKPTHAHLDLTLEWIAKYRPKRAVLTHMSHEFDYAGLKEALPSNVEPAYDGMVLSF